MRVAQLITDEVSVVCPNCGATQPRPKDGSEMWDAEDFRKFALLHNSKMECVSCEKEMLVFFNKHVQFN